MNPTKPQKLIEKAIAMRIAGATMATISESTGLSVSTLYRHFKNYDISRGEITKEAVQVAREKLIRDATFIDNIKQMIAASINDDLSLSRKVRDATALTLEKVIYDDNIPACVKTRSLSALATTMKLTQDIQRRALNIDKENPFDVSENLPTLTILKMTDKEIEELKNKLTDDDEMFHEEAQCN